MFSVLRFVFVYLPFNSLNLALNSFLSSSTRFRPFSMKASNFEVNSAMRRRKSSNGMSTAGSCMSDESAYEIGACWDCDVRNEEVDVEKAEGASAAMIAVVPQLLVHDTEVGVVEEGSEGGAN